MKVTDLTVEIKIINKEKLKSISSNIIELAKLAKDNDSERAEIICNDIIKCFKDLYQPIQTRNRCIGCLDKLEGIFEESLAEMREDENYKNYDGVNDALDKLIKFRSNHMNIIE